MHNSLGAWWVPGGCLGAWWVPRCLGSGAVPSFAFGVSSTQGACLWCAHTHMRASGAPTPTHLPAQATSELPLQIDIMNITDVEMKLSFRADAMSRPRIANQVGTKPRPGAMHMSAVRPLCVTCTRPLNCVRSSYFNCVASYTAKCAEGASSVQALL